MDNLDDEMKLYETISVPSTIDIPAGATHYFGKLIGGIPIFYKSSTMNDMEVWFEFHYRNGWVSVDVDKPAFIKPIKYLEPVSKNGEYVLKEKKK